MAHWEVTCNGFGRADNPAQVCVNQGFVALQHFVLIFWEHSCFVPGWLLSKMAEGAQFIFVPEYQDLVVL